MGAERDQAWPARVGRMFDDLHLVWAGLGATAATFACAGLLLGLYYFSPPERDDSLSAILSAMGSPGSDRNPVAPGGRVVPPAVVADSDLPDALDTGPESEEDLVLALAAVVTQEGRVASPSLLQASRQDRRAIEQLMNAVRDVRLRPASYAGSPVAVNMVWLFERTTVRGRTTAAIGPV